MSIGKLHDDAIETTRGVASFEEAQAWMAARRIEEIECIVPDMAGVARGKLMPASKFFTGRVMNLPESIFYQTIAGDYPDVSQLTNIDPADGDLVFRPDFATLCAVPWENDPTAQVIHDAYHRDGRPVELAPRNVLRRVLRLFEGRGWTPLAAPEIEFYLVQANTDPDYPLEPPIGRSGRAETGRKS
jgi:glutamine synthetase